MFIKATFTNDSNFFVPGVGRGSGALERCLEIVEVLRGEEGDDEDRKAVWKNVQENKFISSVF